MIVIIIGGEYKHLNMAQLATNLSKDNEKKKEEDRDRKKSKWMEMSNY